ncbi:MAG TPA: c-type cytochrome biogenesis protein CcmI [Pyrinomonadaceae bacterium]|nr:c-type cytochrome biogenesis protein CcmI [Pyrinomonadaceae bacterium]
MIVFGLLCAALMIVALLFIFPPLLKPELRDHAAEVKAANLAVYRDQLRELDSDLQNGIISKEQHAQDRNEIERRLLSDVANDGKTDDKPKTEMSSRKLAYALVVVMPIASVLLYLKVGTRQALSAAPRSTATASSQSGDMTQERIEANVAALEKKLEQNPNDGPGWSMLARSYSAMSRHKEASAAFEKAAALDPRNADLLTEYAFSLSMARGQDMEGKPIELLNQALEIDPQNLKALVLAGNAAFKGKRYEQAIGYWEKVLPTLPANSEVQQSLSEKISEAKRLAKTTTSK